MVVTAPGWAAQRGPLLPRAALPRLPAEWSFWAETVTGAEPLGPVQATRFLATRRMSAFPRGEITLQADSSAIPNDLLLRFWHWKVWAFYGGEPYWCGVPDGYRDEGEAVVTFTLGEVSGYLERRQWDVGPPSRRYAQVEQTAIARDIAAPLADVAVPVVTSPGEGFLRDREYEFLEADSRGQLLTNLAEVIDGPQFRTEYSMAGDRPVCTLHIGYPVGTQEAQTGLGLAVPGNGTAFQASWDADELRTRTYAVGEVPEGAPDGTPRPVYVEDRPQPGLPRLDAVDDWAGVTEATTLRERARTAAEQYAGPVLELSGSVPVSDPDLRTYNVGDTVTVRIVTPAMPGGVESDGTLTETYVNAMEGRVDWTVTTAVPPPRPRESLAARLDRIDLMTRAAFRRHLGPPQ